MDPTSTPFAAGWWSFELPGFRDCDGTYCLFPYETLPPLDERQFRGEFQWLGTLDPRVEREIGPHRAEDPGRGRLSARLEALVAEAARLGLALPAAFLRLLGSAALHDRIPSCTACYFELPERITPSPFGDGGWLIRFLNDQQGVLFWYLYLDARGGHGVVVSPMLLDELAAVTNGSGPPAEAVWFCAPSFEAFVYRFWLENTLWFALTDDLGPLTPTQREYLA
jgi:hypothetical protein